MGMTNMDMFCVFLILTISTCLVKVHAIMGITNMDMYCVFLTLTISTCLAYGHDVNSNMKEKRQIYREQVLPFKGGKIPESAFRSDRLNLNQLQREGFSLPDGVVLNNRRHQRHPYPYQREPELLKVYMTDDGRYISVYGKYTTDVPDTIDTTYLIRYPVQFDKSQLHNSISEFPNEREFKTSLLSLVIPSNAIFGNPTKEQEQTNNFNYNNSDYNTRSKNHKMSAKQRTKFNNNIQYNSNTFRNKNINRYTDDDFDRNGYRSQNDGYKTLSNNIQHNNGYTNKNHQNSDMIFSDNNLERNGYNYRNHKDDFQSEDCPRCLHKIGYNNSKSRVWIKRYFSAQKQETSY